MIFFRLRIEPISILSYIENINRTQLQKDTFRLGSAYIIAYADLTVDKDTGEHQGGFGLNEMIISLTVVGIRTKDRIL